MWKVEGKAARTLALRAQRGLITEWMDAAVDPVAAAAAANQNSEACQAVNTALGPATAAR